MSPRLLSFIAVACLLVAPAWGAFGDAACASCANPPAQFPDAARFLASVGYPTQDYTVLLTWKERPPRGDGSLVYGYHVKSIADQKIFDVYADSHGTVLTDADLARLGVRLKNWTLKPLTKDAEIPHELGTKFQTSPTPIGSVWDLTILDTAIVPLIDRSAVLAEDAANESGPQKGAVRVGVFSTLPHPIHASQGKTSLGSWRRVGQGGWLWSVSLYAFLANGLRVHFQDFSLPAGASVIVYNAGMPTEAYGPYTAPYPGETDLWSATCFTDQVVVECYVPPGVDRSQVTITIDKVVYVYRDFSMMQWLNTGAGACNLDVACYPDWVGVATGVGAVGVIDTTGFVFCTGTLLADEVADSSIPYLLTADHCVSDAASASSVEVYWLYQTSACNGVAPTLSTVPRTTGGADYLAGADASSGSDFALLRLRNPPPDGLTFVGWSNVPWSAGTSVACIHHPRADYTRISFGTLTGGSSVMPADRFFETHWDAGTTEPGSAGAPLLLADTQQVIGQLYGGYASCATPDLPDSFGRFDVTYPLIQKWLDPAGGPEDVNGSGSVDAVDIQTVINGALGKTTPYNVDIDRSGKVDAVDVQMVINAALFL